MRLFIFKTSIISALTTPHFPPFKVIEVVIAMSALCQEETFEITGE